MTPAVAKPTAAPTPSSINNSPQSVSESEANYMIPANPDDSKAPPATQPIPGIKNDIIPVRVIPIAVNHLSKPEDLELTYSI